MMDEEAGQSHPISVRGFVVLRGTSTISAARSGLAQCITQSSPDEARMEACGPPSTAGS